jgi:hypothetical protein
MSLKNMPEKYNLWIKKIFTPADQSSLWRVFRIEIRGYFLFKVGENADI